MKKGMDPDAVDQMAASISDAAEQVTQLYNQTKQSLDALDWTGDDRDRYVAAFDELGQQVQELSQQATDLADRATQNASAQRTASA